MLSRFLRKMLASSFAIAEAVPSMSDYHTTRRPSQNISITKPSLAERLLNQIILSSMALLDDLVLFIANELQYGHGDAILSLSIARFATRLCTLGRPSQFSHEKRRSKGAQDACYYIWKSAGVFATSECPKRSPQKASYGDNSIFFAYDGWKRW
jgi:hypothetical protein